MEIRFRFVRQLPVAKFSYKGSHSHPVRRTVVLVEQNDKFLKGYELREGNKTRKMSKAPIKIYYRNKIAIGSSLRMDSPFRRKYPNQSTLKRQSFVDLVSTGI